MMLKKFDKIIADPAILNGKPLLKGSRISVELILEWIASGATSEKIVQKYPHLDKESIQQAIQYAAQFMRNEIVVEVKINRAA